MDYLENTCLARYTGVCDFKPRMGLLLKTVDSVQGPFTCCILNTIFIFYEYDLIMQSSECNE